MNGECIKCHKHTELSKGGRGKYRNVCKPCWNEGQREWRLKNPDRWKFLQNKYHSASRTRPGWLKRNRERGREYWARLKQQGLDVYGRECACCGEAEEKFLTLDHMLNDGAAHRRSLKLKGAGIWKWLKRNGYPAGFQILCMNCNLGRHLNGGICPHQTSKDSAGICTIKKLDKDLGLNSIALS